MKAGVYGVLIGIMTTIAVPHAFSVDWWGLLIFSNITLAMIRNEISNKAEK